MWALVRLSLDRRRGKRLATPTVRHAALEALELRATPAAGLGFAFALGDAAFDEATSVAADNAGNVYVAGLFNGAVDFDPGPGTFQLTSTGAADAFLAKYGPAGNLLWAGQIVDAGPTNGYRLGLALDAGGNPYLTGQFSGVTDFDIQAGVSTLASGSNPAAFVTRYTSAGALVWAKRLGGGTSYVLGISIEVDAAGNVYSAGTMSNGSADMDPGAGVFTLTNGSGNADTYISKLDSSGNFVWASKFANDPSISAGIWPADIAVDAAQNLYLTGVFVGRADFDPGAAQQWRATLDVGFPYGDGYVAKLNASGAIDYVVTLGSSSGREDGNGIAVDASGNAYVAGTFTNFGEKTILSPAGVSMGSVTGSGGFVMKLTSAGALEWARSGGALEIAYDGADALYVTGGGPNAYVQRLGTDGSAGWTALLSSSPEYDFGNDIAVNSLGDVFVAGRFGGSVDFDPGSGNYPLNSAGSWDAFVTKLVQEPTSVVARRLFYNESAFDDGSKAILPADDGAIAPDKSAYLPGDGLATFANVSSYSRGINGIMIDLSPGAAFHAGINFSDFVFKVGSNNSPDSWAPAPSHTAVSVRAGAGTSGSDRVVITWANGTIKNTWLEVRVKANDRTGLEVPDVFYFGNLMGDTGAPNEHFFTTNVGHDVARIAAGVGIASGVTDVRDIDRSNTITVAEDRATALANIGILNRLNIGGALVALPAADETTGDAGISSALAALAGMPQERRLSVAVIKRPEATVAVTHAPRVDPQLLEAVVTDADVFDSDSEDDGVLTEDLLAAIVSTSIQ
ncbi:MAG: hypothetical protein AB7O59_16600 [Pirellulales bacterium]